MGSGGKGLKVRVNLAPVGIRNRCLLYLYCIVVEGNNYFCYTAVKLYVELKIIHAKCFRLYIYIYIGEFQLTQLVKFGVS